MAPRSLCRLPLHLVVFLLGSTPSAHGKESLFQTMLKTVECPLCHGPKLMGALKDTFSGSSSSSEEDSEDEDPDLANEESETEQKQASPEDKPVDYGAALKSFQESFDAEETIQWTLDTFGDGVVLQTSAGIQAAVMLKLVTAIKPDVKVVFVDTGYLPKETTDYMETLRKEFNLNLVIAKPQMTPQEIESQHGKLWETDHELYGQITKVEPMNRILSELGCTAVLSGLRSEQTSNRAGLKKLSYDMVGQRFKVLPILDWSKAQIDSYQKENTLPKHPLEAEGFVTVGDSHSTRALRDGESNARATRFGGKAEECGLHTNTSPFESFSKMMVQDAITQGTKILDSTTVADMNAKTFASVSK